MFVCAVILYRFGKKLLYSAGIQILMNKTKYFEVFAGAATAVVELFVSIFFLRIARNIKINKFVSMIFLKARRTTIIHKHKNGVLI